MSNASSLCCVYANCVSKHFIWLPLHCIFCSALHKDFMWFCSIWLETRHLLSKITVCSKWLSNFELTSVLRYLKNRHGRKANQCFFSFLKADLYTFCKVSLWGLIALSPKHAVIGSSPTWLQVEKMKESTQPDDVATHSSCYSFPIYFGGTWRT